MKDLNGMSASELEDLLGDLRADLEDVEEERAFVLGQTGVHISASTVARYESERESLIGRIEQAEQALSARRIEEG